MLPEYGYNLKISKFIQLGNSLVQLTNAINVAIETKSKLYMPTISTCSDSMAILKHLPDMDFSDGESCNETIESKFFFPKEAFDYHTTNEKRKEILSKYVFPFLDLTREKDVEEDTLVIHIRSGDIFGGWVHKDYVQPPLNYYKKIIENHDGHVILVTQKDKRNPCVNELMSWRDDIHIQTGSLEEDVSAILNAKKLVIGYGSFGWMLSLLSVKIQELFCPKNIHDQLTTSFNIDPIKIKRYTFENYIETGDWECTEEQKQIMIGDVNVIEH